MADESPDSAGPNVDEVLPDNYYAAITDTENNSPASKLQNLYDSGSAASGYNQASDVADRFSRYLGFAHESQYDYNYRVFPDDLGQDHNSHYMIININVQVNRDSMARLNTELPYNDNFGPANYTVLANEASRVDQLRGSTDASLFLQSGMSAEQIFGKIKDTAYNIATNPNAVNLPRSTRKIKEAIALYMPMPTVYTQTNVYEEVSLTAFGAQALKLGVSFIGGAIAAGLTGKLKSAIGSSAPRIVDAAGNMIRKGATAAGMPINPKIEVLFSHTSQRSFRMEILMAPKNKMESDTVKNIIDTLRFHAAPELDTMIGFIPTFIPPAEFDITFFHKGKENTKIPRINTCALEQIEVDYAPTGVYSTFANGHPVAIRLSLAWRELEILHKQRVTQGF
jgi:hypothetical protein